MVCASVGECRCLTLHGSRAWLLKTVISVRDKVFAIICCVLKMAAGVATMKTPPLFKEEEMDYEQWKKDLLLWTEFTDLEKNKMAIAVHLSLSGRARKASSELASGELKCDDGIKNLIKKLDRIFLQDENWRVFNNYLQFENYLRGDNESIDQYLSEFDRRYFKLKDCGVEMPDAVVACRLIKSCNLNEMHFKLALSTTTEMTFENMRTTLKRLFVESGNSIMTESSSSQQVHVDVDDGNPKANEVLYSERSMRNNRGRSYTDRRARGGWRRGANGKNPVGRDGRITTCHVCGSIMHWARECPNKISENIEEECQVVLMAHSSDKDRLNTLLGESIGSVVLDSGCTRTVCGLQWLESFRDTLTADELSSISESPSHRIFKFGDGSRFKSQKYITFPCLLAGKHVRIRTDVVDASIPLLLSKESMKRAGMVIDMNSDTVTVLGKRVNLETTSLGHYILPIFRPPTSEMVHEVLVASSSQSVESVALKLHRQFAHPTSEKLKKLLKNANRTDAKLLDAVDSVTSKCDICLRFKRAKPRPVVSLPLASSFNETVAMDLEFTEGHIFLVMVDLATRYCLAAIVKDKSADSIVKSFVTCWITIFGAPSQILSDNGREFNNEKFRCMGDMFGIKLLCTAAYSPWSNGVCERLNAVLAISVRRIIDDTRCDVQTALSWAVAARNSLHNFSGYSPNQLVFGYNPSLPNVMQNEASALETSTNSELVANHLNAMHSARRDFISIESNERIRRALLHQVRADDMERLCQGDSVYYKRDDDKWHGPATVIGRDGKQVLVRHGGELYRVHTCRLQHSVNSDGNAIRQIETDKRRESREVPVTLPRKLQIRESPHVVYDDEDEPSNVIQPDVTAPVSDLHETVENSREFVSASVVGRPTSVSKSSIAASKQIQPRIGQRIEYEDQDGEKHDVVILSRAGKANGKYKHWYNVQRSDGSTDSVDLSGAMQCAPVNNYEILVSNCRDAVFEAKLKELSNWQANDVYEEVPDVGQNVLSVRWVLTEKQKDGELLVKARLVARGFEENWSDEHRKDSPTCSKDSLRLSLTLISAHKWKVNALDIRSAFLQGEPINREVYLRPPSEFNNGSVWKLKKNVYGLNDAARAWYFKLRDVLVCAGMKICDVDPALFYCISSDNLSGLICVHVDDLMWAGTQAFAKDVISKVHQNFCIGSSDTEFFKFVGIDIESTNKGIVLHQNDYAKSIEGIQVSRERRSQRSADLGDREKEKFKSLIGQLVWLSSQSRPDIAFDVCQLSVGSHRAKVEDILDVNRVVRRVVEQKFSLVYPSLNDLKSLVIECYSDASFGNLSDGGSQGGYVLLLSDGENRCILSWRSCKLKRVVKSTIAAETLALLDGAEAAVLFAHTISLMLKNVPRPIVKCFIDNRSLADTLQSTKQVEDKLLRINMAVLRDMLQRGDIHSVSWVQSSLQLANVLTKRGASAEPLIAAIGC